MIVRTTTLTADDEALWRQVHGVEHFEAWANAHGWTLKAIASGTIVLTEDEETGRTTATVGLFVRDEHGAAVLDRTGQHPVSVLHQVTMPLCAPVPPGILGGVWEPIPTEDPA